MPETKFLQESSLIPPQQDSSVFNLASDYQAPDFGNTPQDLSGAQRGRNQNSMPFGAGPEGGQQFQSNLLDNRRPTADSLLDQMSIDRTMTPRMNKGRRPSGTNKL